MSSEHDVFQCRQSIHVAEFREEEVIAVSDFSQGFGRGGFSRSFDGVHGGVPVAHEDREPIAESATGSVRGRRSMINLSGKHAKTSCPLQWQTPQQSQRKIPTSPGTDAGMIDRPGERQ